jgi:hypothetical protein
MKPNLSRVFDWQVYFARARAKDDDVDAIANLHREAKEFLARFEWCEAVLEEYVGFMYPSLVSVFLFRIRPAREGIDEWSWVVVGDVPPACIPCDKSPNPTAALDAYVGAMHEWVDAVDRGKPTDQLIPVNLPATKEAADGLRTRLKFIDDNMLSGYAADLEAP